MHATQPSNLMYSWLYRPNNKEAIGYRNNLFDLPDTSSQDIPSNASLRPPQDKTVCRDILNLKE
jgi:hypothetical protein